MLDVNPLLTAVDRLADRLRSLPESRLRHNAGAAGLELARELAVRAQRLQAPGREARVMPEVGLFAVGDQVAVAGHDLAEALGGVPEPEGARGLEGALELVRACAGVVR
ncbi:hypothetical protein SRB5_68010 [Streptomyces sp. RB5]|uniref:Uncharacterized protein n=1 Tax=Streptomyces smaragdinus TaxID=2585196 RepID=A0A7K0CT04_9ACTN|nr:hypothetical protein [Streptomyces smaragdinus]MQY16599.1 hypothetical protein [Streptomyces smaragdinus]